VSAGPFDATLHGDGIASLRITTDDDPYMTASWSEGLERALLELGRDDAVRVVILEGGERYFSAGAALESLLSHARAPSAPHFDARVARALLGLPVPTIAAAGGHAIGGGLVLALWCDIARLAEESMYGVSFMQLGFTPGMGATHVVLEAFGDTLGRELLLTGRLWTGREIREARCPLSHAVKPRSTVRDECLAMARDIAASTRLSLLLVKEQLASRRRRSMEAAMLAEGHAHTQLFTQPGWDAEILRRYPQRLASGEADQP
jgi:enoyl-CoA hydratase/carnithine racemase